LCKDEPLGASHGSIVDGIRNCYPGRRHLRIRWCIAQDDFAGDIARGQ
jgi:hypothetical protein